MLSGCVIHRYPHDSRSDRRSPAAGKPAAASEKPTASKKSVTLPKTSTAAKTATATKKSSPSNSLATPALAKAAPPRVPTPAPCCGGGCCCK